MNIKHLYENTELTLQQIADKLSIPFDRVFKYVKRNYSREHRLERKRKCYRNSRLGDKNPAFGKKGAECGHYVGSVSDCKGYYMRVKPDWYTGRKGSRHVFEHSIVVCENLGLMEIPPGWVVHHCDENKINNSFDNLVLIKMGEHTKLHAFLSGATTISKESTLKWVETYGTPWRGDIVSSIQECIAAQATKELTSFSEDK